MTSNRNDEYLTGVSAVSVSVEELLEAADAIHDLPPDEKDFEGRTAAVTELHVPNLGKVVPISFRLEALAQLFSEGVPEEWTLPAADDGNTRPPPARPSEPVNDFETPTITIY